MSISYDAACLLSFFLFFLRRVDIEMRAMKRGREKALEYDASASVCVCTKEDELELEEFAGWLVLLVWCLA